MNLLSTSDLRLLQGIPLVTDQSGAALSSYRGGGNLDCVLLPQSEAHLERIARLLQKGVPYTLIGNASNTLIADRGVHRLAIVTKQLRGVEANGTLISAAAGESLPRLAAFALKHGLGGMEALSGIPATLGGALKMNAGAFGSEIGDLIEDVTVLDLSDGSCHTMDKTALKFDYRSSGNCFDDKLIVSARLRLHEEHPGVIEANQRRAIDLRFNTQPRQPSLGSTFRKAEGIGAGYYIDRAGLKGVAVGGAMVSPKHAGFIVNTGGGTADDYLMLADKIRTAVYRIFKITLVPEFIYEGGEYT